MVDVFDDSLADLSGIAPVEPNGLYVSEAIHKAYVDVNEVGTEAAAINSSGSKLYLIATTTADVYREPPVHIS